MEKFKRGRLAQLFGQASGLVTYEDIRKLRQENDESLKRKMGKNGNLFDI